MKPRSLAVYMVIFILLGLFYYLYEVRLAGREKVLEEAGKKVYQVAVDKVDEVRLTSNGTMFRAVMTAPDYWVLTAPVETRADRWEVEGMIRLVLGAEKDREFEEPAKDLSEYGLDKPAFSLSLYGQGRLLGPTLHVGGQNPAGFLSYGRLGDENRVFMLTPDIRDALAKTLFDIRDRSVMLTDGPDVDRITVVYKGHVELKRTGIRNFEILSPESGPADADIVNDLLYKGLKANAILFAPADRPPPDKDLVKPEVKWPAEEWPSLDEKPDPFGFDDPRLVVRAVTKDGGQVDVTVGRPAYGDPGDGSGRPRQIGYWVKSGEHEGEALLADMDLIRALAQTYDALRDRHVMKIEDIRPIDGIEAGRGERRLKAVKVKDVWDVVEPSPTVSDPRLLDLFLKFLWELRWLEEAPGGEGAVEKYHLNDPDLWIMLRGLQVSHRLEVSLRPVDEKYLAARADGGPVVFIDRISLLNALPEEIRPAP